MIRRKVCMLGGFAVGKTSLVQRFVKSIFSEKYLTTIGVKIDSKEVDVDGQPVKLMLWDIHGEDDFQQVKESYLRGTQGVLLVIDGTRRATLDVALELERRARAASASTACLYLLNKSDLGDDWELQDADLSRLDVPDDRILKTSAKTGEGVEEAFRRLARAMT